MPADNDVFEREAEGWWLEDCHLALLRSLIPARLAYLKEIVPRLDGTTILDVGCGGGLFSEALAAEGAQVTGLDASAGSIAAARRHAAEHDCSNNYVVGAAEALPFDDASFDAVCCCDVLEHVGDVEMTLAECSRVLKTEGIYLFDTINRTLLSRVVLITLFQEWRWTRLVPPGLHDYAQFIKPSELDAWMRKCGLEPRDFAGLSPDMSPGHQLERLVALYRVKMGTETFSGLGARMMFKKSRMTAMNYMGYAVRKQR